MKYSIIIMFAILLTGCFRDNPSLPQYYAEQNVQVPEDLIICISGAEDFTHFNLSCTEPYDSVHWYEDNLNPSRFLGNGNPEQISSSPFAYGSIICLGFTDSDTSYHYLEVNYCGRHIFIPSAFTPVFNDGINDEWKPTINTNGANYSYYMEIRTLDGIQIFQTDNPEVGWDGGYNGFFVPRGAYFYRIELTIEGEETVVYTGWLEFYG
jgi:gliding motility-associated-like protein